MNSMSISSAPGLIRERVAVAGAFPAVAGDLVGAPGAAGREDDRPGGEHLEPPALPLVADDARRASVAHQQRDDGEFHVDVDAAVDAVVLKRADQFEPGAIADVRETRIAVAAEVALEDPAVLGPIEHRAPGFELAHAIGRFLGVQLRHAPVVDVLAAAHRVGEVHFPAVAVVDVGERRGDAALGHDGVRLAEQRLADQPDLHAGRRGFDGRAQSGAARADDENVVIRIAFWLGSRHHEDASARSVSRCPSSRDARRDPRTRPRQRLHHAKAVTAIEAETHEYSRHRTAMSRSRRCRRRPDAAASGS